MCGGRVSTPLPEFSEGGWKIVSCGECGFVFLSNPPEYEQLVSEFAWEGQRPQERERRKQNRSRPVERLNQATRWRLRNPVSRQNRTFTRFFPPGNVLDIGCADGEDEIPRQFVPYGIEISAKLHALADPRMRARGGYAVHGAAAVAIAGFEPGFFKGVVLRSVLEHEKEPHTLLSGINRVLADDGAVYIRVPNFGSVNRRIMGRRWCGFRYPDHVGYFTRKTLRRLAVRTGFRLKILNPLSLFDDNIKALMIKA